ncbi:hypothetical protein G6F70_004881 [Rhizopus microsporus]|uniref:COX assembly mitochondrial protein n=2 Tax=Rhizopus TaxID=4842 RepID=A0A367IVB4_RHIAZ|nr:hypothetical protein G6F71_006449 [Rhizopus microsporus]RCH81559.1 hypothetical protein CU097_003329 [Rhizopus azygosporus]KAG1199475.1 hypothetical protein G6F70_004881 [Rhizopus microsporus]KAG1209278.1 hypothetical protein G6F69_006491 [Rhizopus microsporus]KAG1230750.1 hypothetical protein G6F67_006248 [Rhizopus microsporus]
MTNNNNKAREFIETYVNQSTDEQDYLLKEQPRYDPTKPIPNVKIEEQKKEQLPEKTESHFNIHAQTVNPISTDSSDKPSMEIYTSSREQRNEIHETALTVCADLHENLMTCFQHGSWWDKAKMCEEQKQKFWACYSAQKQFLKGVNYKGPGNTEQEDARILVGAYKLRDKLENNSETA